MEWNQLWQARLGYEIKPQEAAVWELEIEREIRSPSGQEIMDGVRMVADRKRMDKIKFKPGLEDLISAIRFARKQKSPTKKSKLEILTKLKADMKAAMPDNNEMFNVLCRCDDLDLLQRAEAYARRELSFTRPTIREMGCNGVQGLTGGLIKNVTDEVRSRD